MSNILTFLLSIISLSSCCSYVTVKVLDENGDPVPGATQTPTPIIGRSYSDRNGRLRVCGDWAVGVTASNYKTFLKTENGEYCRLEDGEVVVLERKFQDPKQNTQASESNTPTNGIGHSSPQKK